MHKLTGILAFLVALSLVSEAYAQRRPQRPTQRRAKAVQPTPYDAGKVSLSLGGGLTGAGGEIGGGIGYFVIKGLELSVNGAVLLRGETTIGVLGPAARYIVWQVPTVHPYVGSFYRHWFIGNDMDDRDSVGGRAGIITSQDPFYVSAGVVYERFLFCESGCSVIAPEISFGISF